MRKSWQGLNADADEVSSKQVIGSATCQSKHGPGSAGAGQDCDKSITERVEKPREQVKERERWR